MDQCLQGDFVYSRIFTNISGKIKVDIFSFLLKRSFLIAKHSTPCNLREKFIGFFFFLISRFMQGRNFSTDLCFILAVFKHNYLRIKANSEAQYPFRMFCFEETPFNRKKESAKFYFARDIGEKCSNKQNHPVKIDSLFT